jgi:hypothetical protein
MRQSELLMNLRISVASLALMAAYPAIATNDWQHLTTEQGIEISQRKIPGQHLPVFRGVGVIEANLYEIMAVISDFDNLPQWMHKCIEARLLRREGELITYSYSRTDAPWPVRDRYVVLRSEAVLVAPGKEVHVYFRSVESEPAEPVRGAVRMRHIEGHYKLHTLAPGQTRIEYQVSSDPGGMLPVWIVERTSQDFPLHTLLNLRRQVIRTRGSYEEFLDRWDPARSRAP